MSDTATKADIDDLQQIVIILGGAVIGLVIIAIIAVVVSIVYVRRIFKPLKDIAFVSKNTRLDVRKVIENMEAIVKRNPVALQISGDEEDGSERVSPIFTRRMFNSPLPFDLSVLRESREYDRDRSRSPRQTNTGHSNVIASGSRKPKGPSPVVPPRRTHSQGFYGDY